MSWLGTDYPLSLEIFNDMDNERVKLTVLGLSYNSLQGGAYALLLAQEDGPYRIPVVIGAAEAQAIATRMEGITPPRPLTHDLFMSFTQAFGIRLREAFIYKYEDGVFSAELTFDDGERQVVLDARTSDAIAIAMRCKAPIWTTREILDQTGFIIEGDPTVKGSDEAEKRPIIIAREAEPDPERLAVEELEKLMAKHIAEENYEEAARISEIIKRKKS